jgi:hypothetical protein
VADVRREQTPEGTQAGPRRGRGLRWIVAVLVATKVVAVGVSWFDGSLPSTPPALAADVEEKEAPPALAVKPPPAAETSRSGAGAGER